MSANTASKKTKKNYICDVVVDGKVCGAGPFDIQHIGLHKAMKHGIAGVSATARRRAEEKKKRQPSQLSPPGQLPPGYSPIKTSEIQPTEAGLFVCPECVALKVSEPVQYINKQPLGKHRQVVHGITGEQAEQHKKVKQRRLEQGEIVPAETQIEATTGKKMGRPRKVQFAAIGEIEYGSHSNGHPNEEEHELEILITRAYTICEVELKHFCFTHEIPYSSIAPRVADIIRRGAMR